MIHTYSTADAVRVTGLTARQIIYWVAKGWVRPSASYHPGPGNHWRWTRDDLILLTAAAERIAWGLSPERALQPDDTPCPRLPAIAAGR